MIEISHARAGDEGSCDECNAPGVDPNSGALLDPDMLVVRMQIGSSRMRLCHTCAQVLLQRLSEMEGGPREASADPIPMLLSCPSCGNRHVDQGEFVKTQVSANLSVRWWKPHHTHACQACGMIWRPALVPTVGVRFLPGFKDEEPIQIAAERNVDPSSVESLRVQGCSRPVDFGSFSNPGVTVCATAVYPADWPACPSCGAPALDGHTTCGDADCDEGDRHER